MTSPGSGPRPRPRRGEIWDVAIPAPAGASPADPEAAVGREQAFDRPFLVLQTSALHKLDTRVGVPITSNLRSIAEGHGFLLRAGEGGLAEDSAALVAQVRTLSVERFRRLRGSLPPAQVEGVVDLLRLVTGT